MKNKEAGFVYVATGKGYLDEACRSVLSLKKFHPDHPVCLVSDHEPNDPSLFDDFILCPDVERMPIDKTLLILCPYERVVFLDTDTEIFGDLSPLFQMLDQFDIALLQDVNRGWDYELAGVPLSFSEFNTGVIVLKKNSGTRELIRNWLVNYQKLLNERGYTNDQPSFRQTLYYSALRLAPLPSEFHFLANFPNSLLGGARLLHGRGPLGKIQGWLEEKDGLRVYIPEVGTLTQFRGRLYGLKQCLSFIPRLLGLIFFPPRDQPSNKPKVWWKKTN